MLFKQTIIKSFLLSFLLFGLSVFSVHAADVTLSWDKPNDSRITGYNIYYGTVDPDFKSAPPGQSVQSADQTTCLVTGLDEGTHYYFAATSVDADNNESAFSETIGYTVYSVGDTELYSLVFGDTPNADHPGTIKDTYINLNDEVNAGQNRLNTYTWPADMPANAILLKFDLTQLPATAQIQKAILTLYQAEAGGDETYDVSAHKIINHNPELAYADGYTFDGITDWTANAACYDNIPLAQADIAPPEFINNLDLFTGFKQWVITNMVTEWAADASTNYGLLLNSDAVASSDSYRFFAASEASDATLRPRLEIVYTLDPDLDVDEDGDGYTINDGDCDDTNPGIHPDATDTCGDGIDQDCSGSDTICPEDIDDDNDGYTENQGDCKDYDPSINPGEEEICGDGIDQDCDGSDTLCPEDIDNDGDGFTENDGDCNDSDATVYPGAIEVCGDGIDQDCDGSDLTCPEDIDNDGDGFTDNQGDLNDADPTIYPGAEEICGDGIDQDCNGNDLTCPSVGDSESYTLIFGDSAGADHTGTIADTFINIKDAVNAGQVELNTATWPADTPSAATLIKFDLSSLPATAQIQEATLTLYQTGAGGDETYDVSVHKIINHNPDLEYADGYTFDGLNDWTANNICLDSIPLAQADIAPAEYVNSLDLYSGYKNWAVTGMVAEWAADASTNYGLLLNSDAVASLGSHRYFAASEASDATLRPRLEIVYTLDSELDVDADEDGYTINDGDCDDTDAGIHPDATDTCGDGIDQDCDGSDLTCPEDIDNDGDGFTENQGDCDDADPQVYPDYTGACIDHDKDNDGFTADDGDCNDTDASVFPGASDICGDGIDQDCDGSDLLCISGETPGFELEINEIQVNHEWQSITFNKAFTNPVVVAKPMSLNGGQPAVVRIRNVTPAGFEVRIQEWEYLDGWHATETISYMVMEAGHHELPGGIQVEASTFETSSTKNISFTQVFNQIPVVLSGVSTENDLYAVTGRLYNINKSGFDFSLQEQEAYKDGHKTMETMSYIAWEPSAGTVNGMDYIVDSTFDDVTHEFYHIPFYPSFAGSPVFVADMQTRDGGETANIRWKNKNADGIEVQIDEEQSQDSETDHTTEAVGYMAFDPASASQTAIFGDTPDADYPGTIEDTFININNEVNIDSEQLNTYTWPADMPANTILLKFDLTQLPATAQIQKAILTLYQAEAGGDETYDVSAHKIINHNPELAYADGYTFDGITDWTANAACYDNIPLAQADIAPPEFINNLDLSTGFKQWVITNMVTEWAADASTNYGLLLNSDAVASSDSYRFFAASEASDATLRPRLEIVYTLDPDLDVDEDGDGYTINDGGL